MAGQKRLPLSIIYNDSYQVMIGASSIRRTIYVSSAANCYFLI